MDAFPIKATTYRGEQVTEFVPFALLAPHAAQAIHNHGTTLEVLAGRGGLSTDEAVAIIENRPWHLMLPSAAHQRLRELVQDWAQRNELHGGRN